MSNPRIVIDPGHGKTCPNHGPTSYYEYAGMWKLSSYLKEELEKRGCTVTLTRAENEDPSLTARGQKAKGADLFISEHSNAANGSARGVEVYYSVDLPVDKAFAAALSGAVAKLMGNPDRGAKTRESEKHTSEDYYGVIDAAQDIGCPHVLLIENGFHDNAQDEAFLLSDDNLRTIAETQARVICEYIGQADVSAPPVMETRTLIASGTVAAAVQMAAYIKAKNPAVPQSVLDMIPLYIYEGETEGIRGDVAFAQSCLETGNFTYKDSAVTLDQNNFCGMGVTAKGMKGASFPDARTGIVAQIQHLKAYGNAESLSGYLVDPRFRYVKRGSAPYVEWLGQRENPTGAGWATGANYGKKILAILGGILRTPDDLFASAKLTAKDMLTKLISGSAINTPDYWINALVTVKYFDGFVKAMYDKYERGKQPGVL